MELIRGLGVEFRQSITVGRDISFEKLEKDFDAIFIGIGLGETWDLKIPGGELDGVVGAMGFIDHQNAPLPRRSGGPPRSVHWSREHRHCVVTAAKRLGAEQVHLIYRRGESDMPAFRYEYDSANSMA